LSVQPQPSFSWTQLIIFKKWKYLRQYIRTLRNSDAALIRLAVKKFCALYHQNLLSWKWNVSTKLGPVTEHLHWYFWIDDDNFISWSRKLRATSPNKQALMITTIQCVNGGSTILEVQSCNSSGSNRAESKGRASHGRRPLRGYGWKHVLFFFVKTCLVGRSALSNFLSKVFLGIAGFRFLLANMYYTAKCVVAPSRPAPWDASVPSCNVHPSATPMWYSDHDLDYWLNKACQLVMAIYWVQVNNLLFLKFHVI